MLSRGRVVRTASVDVRARARLSSVPLLLFRSRARVAGGADREIPGRVVGSVSLCLAVSQPRSPCLPACLCVCLSPSLSLAFSVRLTLSLSLPLLHLALACDCGRWRVHRCD